ncbi:hypothetical protein KSF78_0005096 [Schistosoma japonicum]|nr:hypothetical protein KSF78_0005096 [Schistosoma japonicum]
MKILVAHNATLGDKYIDKISEDNNYMDRVVNGQMIMLVSLHSDKGQIATKLKDSSTHYIDIQYRSITITVHIINNAVLACYYYYYGHHHQYYCYFDCESNSYCYSNDFVDLHLNEPHSIDLCLTLNSDVRFFNGPNRVMIACREKPNDAFFTISNNNNNKRFRKFFVFQKFTLKIMRLYVNMHVAGLDRFGIKQ